ncbi:MAG TPA: CHAT domain-containing protein [Puia sp.]|nr:CHAT domain-containing protein [Puia sp.]
MQAIVFSGVAQPQPEPASSHLTSPVASVYQSLYRQAEKLYASDNATPHTDSAALSGYQKVIALLDKTPSVNDSILFDSYMKCGILHLSFGESGKALPSFRNAVLTANAKAHLPDSLLFKPYLYIGSCLYDSYDLDSALYYYKLAEDILDNHSTLAESERLYNKVGVLYYESGDYRRSIHYFTKALTIVRSHQVADPLLVGNYQNNIASALLKMEEYGKAIDLYKTVLSNHSYRNELFNNIGTAYLNAGDASEAIRWLGQVRPGNQATYNNLACAWLRLNKLDSAAHNLQQALTEYGKKPTQQKNQDYANTLKYTGDLLVARDSPMKALDYYQRAIIQLDRDFDDLAPEHNPAAFIGLHNSFQLFDALVAKARTFRSLGSVGPDMHPLINSFSAYAAALSLANHVQRMYYSDEARLFLVKKADTVYKETVDLGYRLFQRQKDPAWLEKIFDCQEAGKASVLQARLGDPGLRMLKGKARDLFLEARKGQAEAARLNLLLSSTKDGPVLTQLQIRIREVELRISALQERLDQYPEYYRSKFATGNTGIAAIRKEFLTEEHALLSYYYTSHELYCFYVTRERSGCVVSPWDATSLANILALRNNLDAAGLADRHATSELTRLVSRQLIAPVYDKIKDKSRLIIIPYNEIGYLPFEMLETTAGHRLLVRDFSVSYDYSANIQSRAQDAIPSHYQVLALAPFAGEGGSMPSLSRSSSEVEGLPGRILLNDQATRQQFVRWLPHYPIIHLATHAIANDEDPLQSYIEFYSTGNKQADTLHRLYEQEIYHLGMDSAALVILSACETGNGRLVHGEGLISLSRAFSYAGCKSVITSLWKADDAATAFIIRRVHHYLQKGKPKDQALRLSKIDYQDNPDIEDRYKTPSYWAHLILLGDYKPVAENNQGWWLVIGVIILCLLLAFTWWTIIKNRVRMAGPGEKTGG